MFLHKGFCLCKSSQIDNIRKYINRELSSDFLTVCLKTCCLKKSSAVQNTKYKIQFEPHYC